MRGLGIVPVHAAWDSAFFPVTSYNVKKIISTAKHSLKWSSQSIVLSSRSRPGGDGPGRVRGGQGERYNDDCVWIIVSKSTKKKRYAI